MADNLLDSSNEQLDPQFYIAKYFTPLIEKKWLVILCTIIGLLASIPLSLLTNPEYSSSATVQVQEPTAKLVSKVTDKITSKTGESAYILAEAEKMKSAYFSAEVLKVVPEALREDLDISMDFRRQVMANMASFFRFLPSTIIIKQFKKITGRGGDDGQGKDNNPVTPARVDTLTKRVDIRTKTSRGMIRITARTFDPELAPVLVKSYLDVWTALNMEENKSHIKRELDFTKEQRRDYQLQFRQVEADLRKFKQDYQIPPSVTIVTDPELASQLEVLQTKVSNTKERYKRLDDIYLELSRKENAVVNNIKVINSPRTPLYPSKNIRGKIILFGILIGALIGIAPILLLDYYRGTVRHERDVSNTLDIPIIGEVPDLS